MIRTWTPSSPGFKVTLATASSTNTSAGVPLLATNPERKLSARPRWLESFPFITISQPLAPASITRRKMA